MFSRTLPLSRWTVVAGLTGAMLLPVPVAGVVGATTSSYAAEQSFGSRVVEEARKHDGKDYRYGATGPDAFDCSGYVLYVFRQLGKELPRSSGDQYRASTKVAKADKQPGDLIAFHNSSGSVTHVAIYAGNGNMWVASTGSDRIRLQAIYSSSYRVGRFG